MHRGLSTQRHTAISSKATVRVFGIVVAHLSERITHTERYAAQWCPAGPVL